MKSDWCSLDQVQYPKAVFLPFNLSNFKKHLFLGIKLDDFGPFTIEHEVFGRKKHEADYF